MADTMSTADQEAQRYLLFRIGEETYGTPLLGVREVVEPQTTRPIPNTVNYFSGVINIRGEIVGVIDLRLRFAKPPSEKKPNQALMVFETEAGPMAALVDEVECVTEITENDIEKNPNISTKVSLDYLIGIAKNNDRLVTLIDFNKALGTEDLESIQRSKMAA